MIEINPTLQYFLLFAVSIMLLFLLALAVMYYSLIRKVLSKKQEVAEFRQEKLDQVYSSFAKQLEVILHSISAKSQQLVGLVETNTEKQGEILQSQLTKSAQTYNKMYNDALAGFEQETLKVISSIPQEVRQSFLDQMTNITQLFKGDLEKISEKVSQSTQQVYSNVEEEIQKYRELRVKQVDTSIVEIITHIAKNVLMKEISDDEHEKLVMKALEDAKREGVFSEG